ncbi:MAG: phosphatase PAP2 family protein [Acidimicrobiales bacterium]
MSRRTVVVSVFVALALMAAACGSNDQSANLPAGAEPKAGDWKTWVLDSASSVSVPKPPTGQQAQAEQQEVVQLAGQRTPQVQEMVKRWSSDLALKPWLDLNMELVAHGVKDPPLASRGYALTTIAVYDAVVSAYHWKYEYDRAAPTGVETLDTPGPDPSYPSEHAAIAGAASRVLEYIFPEEPVGIFDDLAKQSAESRVQAGVNFRSDVDAGLALGRSVADKVIARAKTDGSTAKWDGKRPAGIGGGPQYWEPPPGSIQPPTQPLAGTWKTWVLTSASQYRPPAPAPYGSPELKAAAEEVMRVKANLTPDQGNIAKFWAGGAGSALPPGLWNQVALVYAAGAKMDTPRSARLFASLNAGLNDAALAVWDTKFTYWSPRPLNVIRDSGLDPTWTSFIPTPTFPSYTSGHAGYSGAAAVVMSYFFPADAKVFEDKAQEAAMSRLYGGIHFKADNDVGIELGHKVGNAVIERLKKDGAGV